MTRTLYLITGLSIGFLTGFIAGHRYFLYHREKYIVFMREQIRFLRERLNERPGTSTLAEKERPSVQLTQHFP